ncbi:methionyl-tRNA formyltransferase [Streptomyces clavuligerus]|uniref:Bifunctional polymyxin resistance ArnA protein n=1 Tax=Streptomyces clavuligerus TaxID=1901 RepID=B5H0K1_STRCL|nr:formyltransferase family protein [Streptomyces clavuligerus]ANW18889.1 methionyl-tRNA formyltransferase [Streptomyces clavuligerus]AXU13465.1 methionyl-tRNA formyltransferase [Streptomyces clavuligerus]EDY52097.1 bifunctional polymyxin resistance ArnA protein [Streptomyces clavuligerus]EFG08409.1 Bifunctional polymyxin resistance ArnA protein [Streptomyces clavuligerus]MBY6303423.1 methionyl-tRNA formyltransferase [Streptomyces clavuligerus]
MRIVLVSYSAEGFAHLHRVCEEAGHTPVAYVHSRSLTPRGPSRPGAGEVVAGIVGSIPAGMDLLLPGSTATLAHTLLGYEADLLLCYGFPWRFPGSVLRATRLGAVNVHTSLLPRYRGPLPVHWAIRNGDPEIGVSVHWMDERFDTGNLLAQEGGVPLPDDVLGAELFPVLNQVIARLLPTALARAAAGDPGDPQSADGAFYGGWMEPEFSRIDWAHSARDIHNQVRTVRFRTSGKSGPTATLDGGGVTVLRTSLAPVDGAVRVECGDGPLWLMDFSPAETPVA